MYALMMMIKLILDSTTVSFLAMIYKYVWTRLHDPIDMQAALSTQLKDVVVAETGHNEPFYGVHTQSFDFMTAIRYRVSVYYYICGGD